MKHIDSLIKSLSKSEKRYLNINAFSNKTNKNLKRLFELKELDNNNVIICKKLNLTPKQLAVNETRLQNQILKYLTYYHNNKSVENQVNTYLNKIEILYNKGLFKLCEKTIKKAKKIAEEYNLGSQLLRLLKWETYVLKEEGIYLIEAQKKLEKITNNEKKVINQLKKTNYYKYHMFNFLLLSKNRIAAFDKEYLQYEKLYKENKLNPEIASTTEDLLYLLNLEGMYKMNIREFSGSLLSYTVLVELFENNNKIKQTHLREYFFALNNLLILQVFNNKYQSYTKTLQKIYNNYSGMANYKTLLISITKCYELGIYCEIGDVKNGLKLVEKIKEDVSNNEVGINQINKLLFYLNFALIYLFNKDYSNAIFWMNNFLNAFSVKKNAVASNIYYYGNILNVVIHFEAKKYDNIDYLHNQCIKAITKIRPINNYDMNILKFIQQYSRYPNISLKQQKEKFSSLKNMLEKLIKHDETQGIALEFFDFNAWIDSYIYQKTLPEMLASKFKTK